MSKLKVRIGFSEVVTPIDEKYLEGERSIEEAISRINPELEYSSVVGIGKGLVENVKGLVKEKEDGDILARKIATLTLIGYEAFLKAEEEVEAYKASGYFFKWANDL